jgi:Mn-dependent DtxR family transcriptional regulator
MKAKVQNDVSLFLRWHSKRQDMTNEEMQRLVKRGYIKLTISGRFEITDRGRQVWRAQKTCDEMAERINKAMGWGL